MCSVKVFLAHLHYEGEEMPCGGISVFISKNPCFRREIYKILVNNYIVSHNVD